MPRKRPPDSRPSGSSHKKKPAPTPSETDWRDPLYYMHGEITTDSTGELTEWRGNWMASEEGLPSLAEFKEAGNSFELTSTDFLATGVPLEMRCPIGRSGSFRGAYKMADGRSFQDYEHRLVVMDHSAQAALVGERGMSGIGEYVSVGRLVFPADADSPALLTLARRYLVPNDPRGSATPWDCMLRLAGQVTRACREQDDFVPQAPAPWKLPEADVGKASVFAG